MCEKYIALRRNQIWETTKTFDWINIPDRATLRVVRQTPIDCSSMDKTHRKHRKNAFSRARLTITRYLHSVDPAYFSPSSLCFYTRPDPVCENHLVPVTTHSSDCSVMMFISKPEWDNTISLPLSFQYCHLLTNSLHLSIQELPQRLYITIGSNPYKISLHLSQFLLTLANFY